MDDYTNKLKSYLEKSKHDEENRKKVFDEFLWTYNIRI
jgi:hypothetical protein